MNGIISVRNLVHDYFEKILEQMDTPINDPLKVDEFFMENIWDVNDLYNAQCFVRDLVKIYVKLLSDLIELPEKDTFHLAYEMTYMACSILVDTSYRIKKKNGRPAD